MPLPSAWIDALFARLVLRYGSAFMRQYAELDVSSVMADWGDVLDGISGPAIKHALAHLPADRPPNAMQFRAACLAAPGTGELAALAYTAPPQTEQQRDVLRVTAGALAAQPLSPGRYCMERLQTFEDRTGRRLNPAQRFQLDALELQYGKPAEAAQEARA